MMTEEPQKQGKNSFFSELQRRNVFRVASVYAITAWLVIQIAVAIFPYLKIPEWVATAVIVFFLLGFPIALVLAWAFEMSPEGIVRTSSYEAEINPYPPAKKKPFTGTIINLSLVALLILQYLYFNYWNPISSEENKPVPSLGSKSIAVLPFENLSTNKENEYFSDGLTEDIITQLSKINSLRVISRTSVLQYKENPRPVRQIAGDLGITIVLEGSVRRVGDRIRISGQLIDAVNDRLLWADSYNRNIEDVFEVQSEIAKIIASTLETQLSPSEMESIEKKPTDNITAYDFYLKGRDFYYQYTDQDNEKAIAEFKKAIELDPGYALAWAGLGDAYSQKNTLYGYNFAWNDSSIAAGEKAVALDPGSSEAYKALANAYNYARQYDRAFELLKKAVVLNPNNAAAVGNLGSSYFLQGKLAEALKWQKKAALLNPQSPIPSYIIGWTYRLLGDHDSAEIWLSKSIEKRPLPDAYRELAYSYVIQGKESEALGLIPAVLELEQGNSRVYEMAGIIADYAGDTVRAADYYRKSISINESVNTDPQTISPIGLGRILLKAGDTMEANSLLARATALSLDEISDGSEADDPPYNLAAISAIQGRNNEALQWLKKAIEYRLIDYGLLENSPYFENIRDEPEFQQMIDSLKLQMKIMHQEAINEAVEIQPSL